MNKIIPLVDISNTAYSARQVLSPVDVANSHKWNYQNRGMNFDKDLGLAGKYCYHPFNTITVDGIGDVYVCICQAWLPISVGKIWDFDSLTAIVQSPRAREIQASILDGSYRYCDSNTCSIIQEGELSDEIAHRPDTVNWINFALDPSCNLTCPSCRKDFIFVSDGPEFELKMKIVDHLVNLIQDHEHWIKFTLSGDGDPFASLIYRALLSKLNLKGRTDVEIEIVTNGILAKAHWHKLTGVHNNIVRFKVSFDAATEDVYNITRRGGDWGKLLESTKYLVDWKKSTNSVMAMTANFVVQTSNYRDMIDYVELCDQLGFDEINFQAVNDWGTFDNFKSHAVWQSDHPLYSDFLTYLHHPSLNNSKVNLTNLSTLKHDTKRPSNS